MLRVAYRNRRVGAEPPQRRGFTLFGVMICFVVVSLLTVSWIKAVSFERQQLRTVEERLQAETLAEAALDRAVARLGEKPDYAGETWNIPAAELSGSDPATVEIKVAAVADAPDRREIRITADYPADPVRRVRRSRQLIVDVGPAATDENATKRKSDNPGRSK